MRSAYSTSDGRIVFPVHGFTKSMGLSHLSGSSVSSVMYSSHLSIISPSSVRRWVSLDRRPLNDLGFCPVPWVVWFEHGLSEWEGLSGFYWSALFVKNFSWASLHECLMTLLKRWYCSGWFFNFWHCSILSSMLWAIHFSGFWGFSFVVLSSVACSHFNYSGSKRPAGIHRPLFGCGYAKRICFFLFSFLQFQSEPEADRNRCMVRFAISSGQASTFTMVVLYSLGILMWSVWFIVWLSGLVQVNILSGFFLKQVFMMQSFLSRQQSISRCSSFDFVSKAKFPSCRTGAVAALAFESLIRIITSLYLHFLTASASCS